MWWGTAVQRRLSTKAIKREGCVPWSLLSLCQLHVIHPQRERSEEYIALSLFPVEHCGLGQGIMFCEACRAVCVCVGEWLYLLCFIQGNVKDFQLWVISKKDNVPYPLIGQWVESAAVVHSRPSVCHSNCWDPPREYKGQFPRLSLSLSQVMSFPSVSRWVMCYRHCLSGAKAGTLLLRLWTDRSPCRWNSSRRTSIASSSSSLVPQTRCPYLRVSFIPGFLI